jgi:hypothetical protein
MKTDKIPDWPALMPPGVAASYLGVSAGSLRTMKPPARKLGSGRTMYARADLDKFIDSLPIDGAGQTDDDSARLDRLK